MTRRWPTAALGVMLAIATMPARAATPDDPNAEASARTALGTVQHDIAAGRSNQAALRKRSADAAAEVARYRQQSVTLAGAAQKIEQDLSNLQTRLDELNHQEAQQRADLLTHQKREAALLAALQRIAIEPPAALAFSPGSPVDSLRSAMLISDIQPRLAAEAAALSGSLKTLAATRQQIDQQRAAIISSQTELGSKRHHLAKLIVDRQAAERTLHQQSQTEQRQLAALAARAGSLQELITQAEQARAAREAAEKAAREAAAAAEARHKATGSTPSSGGDIDLVSAGTAAPPDSRHARAFLPGRTLLIPPVSGHVTSRFGSKDGYVTARGLTIAARPGATVVSPFDGVVLFSGPFKGYGEILIIDHGGGYASLLARLDRRDAVVGQHLTAGEPVGTMPGSGDTAFYMEIRHNNQPIDPLPLLQRG